MAEPRPVAADLETRDAAARARALDIGASFLVQAPAGSGKTGLLIQRVLALLAHVDRPERIVAMTFTRKAAAEMRERVLAALREAEDDVPVDPASAHHVLTRRLAVAALAQDRRCGWQLTAQPSRLRMLTIDALTAALARQAPVTTGLGALPAFAEDAAPLYAAAARDALAAAPATDPAWRRFLAHVDNDADGAAALLAALLSRRDQWLRLPIGGDAAARDELRAELERGLVVEIETALAHARAQFAGDLVARLPVLERYAAGHLAKLTDAAELAAALRALADGGGVPAATADALADWVALADWLLVKSDARFRASVTKANGFPPAKAGGDATSKAAFEAWRDDAAAAPGLAAALSAVRELPAARYGDDAWAFVDATLTLMARGAAHLLTVFAREGETDFAEATLRALDALGGADDPGELLLAVDYRIEHLLVDEFQDTSWTQLALIARLTSGWEAGDGRTLFAVGDPMQSIYRFREAEVGIFVDAQARARVGAIAVECLELACNFRSRRPVIGWINRVFPGVLPGADDSARAEVAYKPVLATQGDDRDLAPTLDVVANAAAEAEAVVRRIRAAEVAGATTIAVLVRARAHLDAILPALRREGIAFTALDLESLAERLATRDLAALTTALVQPADRLAALAVLRAPWCGLTLADLLAIANAADGRTILEAAADPAVTAALSADGRARVARVVAALAATEAARGCAPLVHRVRAAWLTLGGPACGEGTLDLAGAERFFAVLAAHERGGDLPDRDAFAAAVARLSAEPAQAAPVQVMTLHKAKGLEFDTVILPGLARTTGHGTDDALRWKVRERDGKRTLMLAPMRPRVGAASEPDPVYRYLGALAAAEEAAELGRLLYVGCTRAIGRLHLIAAPRARVPKGGDPEWAPKRGSALAQLWPMIAAEAPPPAADAVAAGSDDAGDTDAADSDDDGAAVPTAPPLLQLPLDWHPPAPRPPIAGASSPPPSVPARPAFEWAHATAAAIGTVAHRLFADVARDGPERWDGARIAAESARIHVELASEGVPASGRKAAADEVARAVRGLVDSEQGRWLFASTHTEAASEWALAGVDGGAVAHVVLDRTFVAAGVRWIVDFKTGTHEGADVAGFLDREVDRYREQLERYARFVAVLDPRPIRLALFYPRIAAWRQWTWTAPIGGPAETGPSEIG